MIEDAAYFFFVVYCVSRCGQSVVSVKSDVDVDFLQLGKTETSY